MQKTGRSFFDDSEEGHVDFPKVLTGNMVGGLFAIFIPDPDVAEVDPGNPTQGPYADAANLPSQMETGYAEHAALSMLAGLSEIERTSNGKVGIATTVDQIRQNMANDVFTIEIHFEGAEPIDPSLETLEAYYLAGLRSIGLTWSRSNAFATGVPFQFPGTPDVGPGLTDAGKSLITACNELGIMLDVSHLNEAGFWDLAKTTDAPIVATHAGAHHVSPSTRNLTDKQLDAIRDSRGLVGTVFHVGFLRPDGQTDSESTTVAAIADHVDYLVDRLGIDKVGLGSDFDGAMMPGDLKNAAGLGLLGAELGTRGYDQEALDKIGHENWLRVLGETWKS